ncbi:hypothetical protein HMPREF1982_00575 [Clostridiales bacterium oral taxon 876 str. F0540]|nr:hypothetical protein HMPREF1982_00575 [Clostridiales bacterium oral taxon 876 str. F0540]
MPSIKHKVNCFLGGFFYIKLERIAKRNNINIYLIFNELCCYNKNIIVT